MEGQKVEIPEDPSQTLPERSPMDPIWYNYFFIFPEIKKTISRGDLGQHRPEKFSSRSWIRRGAISCSPHTSFHEINDSVVNSERGELVRGSDPHLVYSAHSTAGDLLPAPIRLLLKTFWRLVCRQLRQKLSIVSQRGKNRILRGCDGRPQDNTSNLSCSRAWIEISSSALSPTLRAVLIRCHLH